MGFREDLVQELSDYEDGPFEYFNNCKSPTDEYVMKYNDGKPFRALGYYTPKVIESPPGEGGGEQQHYLVEFTNDNDPSDVHYIKFGYYYNSWVGSECDDINEGIVSMKPVHKWVTVYEPE